MIFAEGEQTENRWGKEFVGGARDDQHDIRVSGSQCAGGYSTNGREEEENATVFNEMLSRLIEFVLRVKTASLIRPHVRKRPLRSPGASSFADGHNFVISWLQITLSSSCASMNHLRPPPNTHPPDAHASSSGGGP